MGNCFDCRPASMVGLFCRLYYLRPSGGRVSMTIGIDSYHMKKFADICSYLCRWQKLQLKQSCQHNCHIFDSINYIFFYICFFLAVSSTTSNFLGVNQEVQLFASLLMSTKIYFYWAVCPSKGL